MSEHPELGYVHDCDKGTAVETSRKCRLCEIDPGFLAYFQFGPSVSPAARLQIERYVKRILQTPVRQSYDDTIRNSRKRRRRDDDDSVGDAIAGSETTAFGSALAIYSQDVGFDLDTTNDPEMEEGCPRYERGTNAVVGVPLDSAQALGNPCFNCSMLGHELRSCPRPLDRDVIEANRSAFKQKGQGQFNSRLYLVVEDEKRAEEMRQRIRPGQPLSRELREALGLEQDDDVPEYIQSIYSHGYPSAYLGSAPDQDPLLARDKPATQAPSTPMLAVYNEGVDYACGSRADIEDPKAPIVTRSAVGDHEADGRSSDEDGALSEGEDGVLSEGEVDSEPDELGAERDRMEAGRRNIPLVSYPGLDLAEFDFSSNSSPGRPLRPHTPHRRGLRGKDEYRYYDELQTDQNAYGDPFAGMLASYYRSSQRTGDMNSHWQHDTTIQSRYDDYTGFRYDACSYNSTNNNMQPSTHSSPPPQPDPATGDPQTPVFAEQHGRNCSAKTAQQSSAANSDLEDGECDMEESD
ncbi:hypothetical protein GGF42_002444 [Coemansia sp. RSA 2424]|nr:hypothetical protein GGF42_002444 [Coemansia sp. RSA 2424]